MDIEAEIRALKLDPPEDSNVVVNPKDAKPAEVEMADKVEKEEDTNDTRSRSVQVERKVEDKEVVVVEDASHHHRRMLRLPSVSGPDLRLLGLIKVIETRSKEGGVPKVVERWGDLDASKCVLAASIDDCKTDSLLAVARKCGVIDRTEVGAAAGNQEAATTEKEQEKEQLVNSDSATVCEKREEEEEESTSLKAA